MPYLKLRSNKGRKKARKSATYAGKLRRPRRAITSIGNVRVGDVATSAWYGVKYLASMINSEKFHKDNTVNQSLSTTPGNQLLANIAQGDGDGARTGNSILVKGISYNGTISIHPSASISQVRLVVVMDKQQIGDTGPGFGDIYDTGTNLVQSLMNPTTLGRFTVLMDKQFYLAQGSRESYTCKGFIPLKNHIRYNGANTTDIQKNGIYLFYLSNEATNTPSLVSTWRLFYHDN